MKYRPETPPLFIFRQWCSAGVVPMPFGYVLAPGALGAYRHCICLHTFHPTCFAYPGCLLSVAVSVVLVVAGVSVVVAAAAVAGCSA